LGFGVLLCATDCFFPVSNPVDIAVIIILWQRRRLSLISCLVSARPMPPYGEQADLLNLSSVEE
jgi:hypothetical protein